MSIQFSDSISSDQTIAIDIGFSENTPTTGLAYRIGSRVESTTTTFAGALNKAADLLRSTNEKVNLILEAPLSYYFDGDNPYPRRLVSPSKETIIERGDRAWYLQSGALTTLAAQRFVLMLNRRIDAEICLIEGLFLNQKNDESNQRPHIYDAEILRDNLKSESLYLPDVEGSILDLVSAAASQPPPLLALRYSI
jgi:hypothetical protein